MTSQKIVTSGKRKAAIARASLVPGSGKVFINKVPYENLNLFNKLKIQEPLSLTESVVGKNNFDVKIFVRGGGEKSQIEAARLSLAKAILEFTGSKELKNVFIAYDRNLLIADVRRKETYKPGDSKARAKRQTSYR